MSQLPLDLPLPAALERADFLVSVCNEAAFGWVERWPDWPAPGLILYGPPCCGKTHLAALWRRRSGGVRLAGQAVADASPSALAQCPAVAVDDAETAAEIPLLHLYNCCAEAGTSLLLTTRSAPASWPIALPDLGSRLRSLPAVGIAEPDDGLLGAVLVKHFADRQLAVAPGVIAFLVRRMERSFAAAAALTAQLDREALGAGRPVGLGLARRVLSEAGGQP